MLLDEPELHLNPGLLQGLADFYHRHLGTQLNNQLWLVTHSDALLRQAVGNKNFSAFHLRTAANTSAGENQALRITTDDELDRAVIELVGDLATYKPKGKVVIFEGGGDSKFDVRMVTRLFPDFAQRVNLVSGESKARVRDLYRTFSNAATQAGLSERFYAITDLDSHIHDVPEEADVLRWDRYHIENYLLEPQAILAAIEGISGTVDLPSSDVVRERLQTCASSLVPRLVLDRLRREAHQRIVQSISIGADAGTSDPAEDLRPSLIGSKERLATTCEELLNSDLLRDLEDESRDQLTRALADDEEWMRIFPGRLVIGEFVSRFVKGITREYFSNLIIDQMVDDGHQPDGMKRVLAEIDSSA